MAYSDFDLKKVVTDFSLVTSEESDLFADVPPVIGSELARSVYLIAPILAEAMRRSSVPVTIAAARGTS